MAKRLAGVDSERAVTYGSMMASAVPATGTLKTPASTATPPQQARSLVKQVRSSFQDANSNRNIDAKWNAKITKLTGMCVHRARPPTRLENKDRPACDMKNSDPNG